MPEGDTLFRTAEVLHRALAGQVLTRFEAALAPLAAVDDEAPLAGRTVIGAAAQGKHLLVRFSAGAGAPEGEVGLHGPLTLRTHLRMSGSWHLYRPGERWRRPRSAMRIVLAAAVIEAVAFDLVEAELLDADALRRHAGLRRLGPDLLGAALDVPAAVARLRARGDAPIGEVLLEQRTLAGLGNVYRSEVLFLAGLHPDRPVSSVDDAGLAALVDLARGLLQANVGGGARVTTGRDEPGAALWVYGRGGLPCRRCGAEVVVARTGEGARVRFHCPECQR
jgi:endonuclease-8